MEVEKINIEELDIDKIATSYEKMYDKDHGGSKIIVIGKPGCFAAGTKIIMSNGSLKAVENVKVSDMILGDDYTARKVLDLYRGYDIMYDIIPQDSGQQYTVNRLHNLALMYHDESNNKYVKIKINVENYLKIPFELREKFYIYRSFGSNFPNTRYTNLNFRRAYIAGLKVAKYDKKINNDILFGTCEIRRHFLAGLLDYGMYKKLDNFFILRSICSRKDVQFLLNSMGIFVSEQEKLCGKILFSLPYKKIHSFSHSSLKELTMSHFFVSYRGYGDYYGFEIDKNHKFLLSSFDVVYNTGKSTLITSLLYHKKNIIPVAVAMSGTEDSNRTFSQFMPSLFIHNSYQESKINDFITRQKYAKRYLQNPWGVLILDDCTDDPKVFQKPLQQSIFKCGRHWKMLYIVSLQYAMDIKPVIRSNVDGVFILREPSLVTRRKIWENYASIIPTFDLFCQIMDAVTQNYTALYIDNSSKSNIWTECVFWYKPPIVGKWRFGAKEFWKFHKENFNSQYGDDYNSSGNKNFN